jgi:SAM-dependent methyltransferase
VVVYKYKEAKMEEAKLLKLDLGCGKNKIQDFIGVDSIKFDNVDIVLDLCEKEPKSKKDKTLVFKRWPWEDNSVDEVHCSHFIEHLEPAERIHFVNELYRVLKPGCKATIIAPHWASCRSYGDLTHKWPPVSEFWFYYLSKEWRDVNAPHNVDYNCNFICTWGYSMHPALNSKNEDYKNYALANYKESAQDIVANFTKP